jgi:hypothetical protein
MGVLTTMKYISELQAFTYKQIVSAVQIMNIMERNGLDKDDLITVKKSLEKRMLSSRGSTRKKKPAIKTAGKP